MQYTYNFQLDVNNRAMEKTAGIGNTFIGAAGGGLLGALGGATTHYINGNLQADSMEGIDPEVAAENRANRGSMLQAALKGGLLGSILGGIGSGAYYPVSRAADYDIGPALTAAGLGGLGGGMIAGVAQPSPGDMVRDYKADRVKHMGIPADNTFIINQ